MRFEALLQNKLLLFGYFCIHLPSFASKKMLHLAIQIVYSNKISQDINNCALLTCVYEQ